MSEVDATNLSQPTRQSQQSQPARQTKPSERQQQALVSAALAASSRERTGVSTIGKRA